MIFFSGYLYKVDHSLGPNLKIVIDAMSLIGLAAADQFVGLGWLCTSFKPKLRVIV